ncbi:MAG: ATP-binding cassette domain-containing protein [Eubacteriales bacterium]
MKINYGEIVVKKRRLLNKGEINLVDKGINVLLGANGNGKTLLLKKINYKHREDSVLLEQDNSQILEEISVIENIAMTDEQVVLEKVRDTLEKLGLKTILNLNCKNLSGGEKRLISLLRAIFSNKSLILLDEPTNDLDYKMVEKITSIIKAYTSKKTFLIVTHDDRIEKVANKVVLIDNQEIKIVNEGMPFNAHKKIKKNIIVDNNNIKLINKVFKYNYFTVLLIFLLLVFLGLRMHNMSQHKSRIREYINENQINVLSPLSISSVDLMDEGAIPISMLNLFGDEEISVAKMKKKLNKSIERVKNMVIPFGVEIESTNEYDVYPLEYYGDRDRKRYLVLETYLRDILNINNSDVYIDTSNYFDYMFINSNFFIDKEENSVELDKEIFKKSVEYVEKNYLLENEVLECLFYTIVLKDNLKLKEFIENDQINNLMEENLFIQSNETIELINQINVFSEERQNIKLVLIAVIVFIVFDIMHNIFRMINNKNLVLVFKNYGYKKKDVKKSLFTKQLNLRARIISVILMLIINFLVFFLIEESQLLLNYIYVIGCFFAVSISYKINKWIILYNLNRYYGWRYR